MGCCRRRTAINCKRGNGRTSFPNFATAQHWLASYEAHNIEFQYLEAACSVASLSWPEEATMSEPTVVDCLKYQPSMGKPALQVIKEVATAGYQVGGTAIN